MEKTIRHGKVAVLVSHGFGAGWYTWNKDSPECLFEPKIVALLEAGADADQIEYLAEELYGEGFYTGGADGLTIEWVPQGTRFEIEEYDGNENLRILSPTDGFIA